MDGLVQRQGFTLTEMLAVVVILVFLLTLFITSANVSREAARRAVCENNLKQIGLAFHNFHDAHRRMPPASGVTLDEDGKIAAVDGWSYLVYLLPYLEYGSLYNTLDVKAGRPLVEPEGKAASSHALARRMVLDGMICPSYRGSRYADPRTKADTLTSYKVLGATHHESLSVASPEPETPRYNPQGKHPDGACYPGSQLKFQDFAKDGTSHTVLACETIEPRVARWAIGADATLVGLAPIVQFERFDGQYYAPAGFDGRFDGPSSEDRSHGTYLSWDYDAEPYDGADGLTGGKFGPSSKHPGVVNHLFVDGAVRSISKDIDVAAYMFLITRRGHDPAGPLFAEP